MLEEGTSPELKEGYYIGDEIPKTHPYFLNKRLNSGPNMWPSESSLPDVQDFKSTSLEYYGQVVQLAKDILKVLALTLDLSEDYFDEYARDAVATMRLSKTHSRNWRTHRFRLHNNLTPRYCFWSPGLRLHDQRVARCNPHSWRFRREPR
jgi:isopenicillin N synthase-like dioxygenase